MCIRDRYNFIVNPMLKYVRVKFSKYDTTQQARKSWRQGQVAYVTIDSKFANNDRPLLKYVIKSMQDVIAAP